MADSSRSWLLPVPEASPVRRASEPHSYFFDVDVDVLAAVAAAVAAVLHPDRLVLAAAAAVPAAALVVERESSVQTAEV